MSINQLYLVSFASALLMSLLLTPAMRFIALKFEIFDHPASSVKTHKVPTPYLGGIAVWFSIVFSLIIIRFFTHFPTGTLRSLRGILFGSLLIVITGIIDDLHIKGMHFNVKFIFQFAAAAILVFFGIKINFITPNYIAVIFTLFWVVGITNAFNIIDVMDGLSSGLAVVASLAFLLISLPTEELYVNFAACVLCGAALGFFPYNLSKRFKIFLGDTGSLQIGFILSALSMGTSYTSINNIALFSPVIILALPIFDTLFVSYLRIKKNMSPFVGSKDHFALRLEYLGLSRKQVLAVSVLIGIMLSLAAYFSTKAGRIPALAVYGGVFVFFMIFAGYLMKADVK